MGEPGPAGSGDPALGGVTGATSDARIRVAETLALVLDTGVESPV